jgi:hypothetical protein
LLLQHWVSAPHVAGWWNERVNLASIEAKYGPRVDGIEQPTYSWQSLEAGQSVGFSGTYGLTIQNMADS